MKYAVSTEEMKRCDRNTISHFGVQGLVLMERAALCVCDEIDTYRDELNEDRNLKVLILAGCGNNGGDGIAVARLLKQRGYNINVSLVGDYTKCTDQLIAELKIAENYGISADTFSNIRDNKSISEWDIIVDALFGIGCNRPVSGMYAEAVSYINSCKKERKKSVLVLSVDMPSGVNSDDGKVFNIAVCADVTVTFNYMKLGQIMYPGCEYCGRVLIRDAGIYEDGFMQKLPRVFYYDENPKDLLPLRKANGNKGTFGRILVIAGSDDIYGACAFCSRAAFGSGAGMVRVFTSDNNRTVLQSQIPEAMIDTYECGNEPYVIEALRNNLKKALEWSTEIIIGPGLGTGKKSKAILEMVLEEYDRNIVMDADALNMVAEDDGLMSLLSGYSRDEKGIIITPHLAEFARLYGLDVKTCKENIMDYVGKLASKLNCTVICKDARTIVATSHSSKMYINVTGNDGMATAGSGDVLAGIVGALWQSGLDIFEAACVGTYIHGLSGDMAAEKKGKASMIASDIIEYLPQIIDNK
ncbi:MAG: NAD(P)H-hydrate dehydratase [Butyrivibrio sp.]|nr:NAD(P)H-hydrate dehydratase [Butyrivibrio sp.]